MGIGEIVPRAQDGGQSRSFDPHSRIALLRAPRYIRPPNPLTPVRFGE